MTAPGGAKPSNWADLGVRTLSAVILIPLVLITEWAGGIWFELLVAALGCAVAYEWVSIVFRGAPMQLAIHLVAAIASFIFMLAHLPLPAIGVLVLLQVLSTAIAERPATIWRSSGVLYTGLPCIALLVLRHDADHGLIAVLWCFAIVWASDILAYFAGRLIGGPKLAPTISPKKTWAGLGGAVAGAALASWAVAHFAAYPSILPLALIAAALAVVEQVGDLFESSLKRHYGVKDSGKLIPGHGGVLDRIDGLIFVVIAAALIGSWRAGADHAATGLMVW